MYFTIYKITNTINGKIYVGAHQTTKLADGYPGSGSVLRLARKKHGNQNFKKDILFLCDDIDHMYELERLIVDKAFVSTPTNYNMAIGGERAPTDRDNEDSYYFSDQHKKNADLARSKAVIKSQELKKARIQRYYDKPKLCVQCNTAIDYYKKVNKFCSSSCSATSTNTGRVLSAEHKRKTSAKLMSEPGLHKRALRKQRTDERLELTRNRISLIKSLDIDVHKRGWVTKIHKVTGIQIKDVKRWLIKNMPEFKFN